MLGLPLWRNLVGIGRCQPAIVGFHIVTETGKYEQVPPIALGFGGHGVRGTPYVTPSMGSGGTPHGVRSRHFPKASRRSSVRRRDRRLNLAAITAEFLTATDTNYWTICKTA
jgi:hypothetical protein